MPRVRLFTAGMTEHRATELSEHRASEMIGENVRTLRKGRGWTVAQLAERADLSAAVIENIEHGRKRNGVRTRDVTVDEVLVLADALEVTPGILLPALNARYELIDAKDREELLELITGTQDLMRQFIGIIDRKGADASLTARNSLSIFKDPRAPLHPDHPETQPVGFEVPEEG